MKVFETTKYLFEKKKLLKKRKHYASVDAEISEFFTSHNTFDSVFNSNYFIQSKGGLKIIKIRLPNSTMNQGKSGGYRLILGCNSNTGSIVLLTIYPKIGSLGKIDLENDEIAKLLKNFQKNREEGELVEYPLPENPQTDTTIQPSGE